MTEKTLLKIIRGFCAVQFLGVIFYVLPGGILKSEIFLLAISGAFGLMLDGFTRTTIQAWRLNQSKKQLDDEYKNLMSEFDQKND